MKLTIVEKKTFLAGLQCTLTSSCAKALKNIGSITSMSLLRVLMTSSLAATVFSRSTKSCSKPFFRSFRVAMLQKQKSVINNLHRSRTRHLSLTSRKPLKSVPYLRLKNSKRTSKCQENVISEI